MSETKLSTDLSENVQVEIFRDNHLVVMLKAYPVATGDICVEILETPFASIYLKHYNPLGKLKEFPKEED